MLKNGRLLAFTIMVVLLALTACSATESTPIVVNPTTNPDPPAATTSTVSTESATTAGLILPTGYAAEIVVEGLQGPTQILPGPDDTLWVAQLAGGENAGQGQVVSISLETGDTRLLVSDLTKPTGIALVDNALWIAAGKELLRAPITAQAPITIGTPEVILSNLPTNGRSNGTLSVTPAGELLYETSGARRGNAAAPNSATLWVLSPTDTLNPRVVATGFKNAYAHAYDSEGRLWTTDVADDPVNGQAPPDELNLVVEGATYGWPSCYGNQEPALDFGGTEESCRQTRPSVVNFDPHSTPVGLVASPWENNVMIVALWDGPQPGVYTVAYEMQGDNATGTVTPFVSGLARPQHLLTLSDGSLLLSDFDTGTIYRITRP